MVVLLFNLFLRIVGWQGKNWHCVVVVVYGIDDDGGTAEAIWFPLLFLTVATRVALVLAIVPTLMLEDTMMVSVSVLLMPP